VAEGLFLEDEDGTGEHDGEMLYLVPMCISSLISAQFIFTETSKGNMSAAVIVEN